MQAFLILIGLALIYGAFLILAEVLKGLGNVAGEMLSDSKDLFYYWLGRKSLGYIAAIPEILRSGETPFPEKDQEKHDLEKNLSISLY